MSLSQHVKGVAVGAAVAVALYMSGLLVIFAPLPLVYVAVTRGRRDGWAAALLALSLVAGGYAVLLFWTAAAAAGAGALPIPALSLAAFYSPAYLWTVGVGYFAFFAAVALALGEGVYRHWGLVRWGAAALAVGLVCLALVVAAALLPGMEAAGGGLRGYLAQLVGEIAAMNSQSGGAPDLSFLANNSGEIVALMLGVAPSCLFVFALLVVILNLLVARRFIRGHHAFAHVHNVARFRLPDAAVWAIVAAGAAFFADGYIAHTGTLKVAALNVLIAFGALYFLQGLAVVVYFLQRIRAPLLKTLAYVAIIFFFQTIGMVIVAIGVADVWADFRLRSCRAKHHPS